MDDDERDPLEVADDEVEDPDELGFNSGSDDPSLEDDTI